MTQTVPRMPRFYRPPLGLPLNWKDEVTGELPSAVLAFYHQNPTSAQLTLVIEFLAYFIHAPCWQDETGALEMLRAQIKDVQTLAQVTAWIADCLEIGLDPL